MVDTPRPQPSNLPPTDPENPSRRKAAFACPHHDHHPPPPRDMSSALAPSRRRYIPVRVADVPLEKRRQAARLAVKREDDMLERWRIFLIAEDPGELIAWIAP